MFLGRISMNILYLLIALQVLDLITTVIALRNPKLTEGNKRLKPLIDRFGVLPALLLIKGTYAALLFWAVPLIPAHLMFLVYAVIAGYCWIVWNNVKLIREN
jgi:ABC-type branched-subunit amino acid transport system permease subunit